MLPHEQHEDQEALDAVAHVRDVEDPGDVIHSPRDHLQRPGHAHHDEQPQVQAKPKTIGNPMVRLVRKSHHNYSRQAAK